MSANEKTLEKMPKKTVALSFAGLRGYKALDFLNEAPRMGTTKSGLVVDALLLYKIIKEADDEDILERIDRILKKAEKND